MENIAFPPLPDGSQLAICIHDAVCAPLLSSHTFQIAIIRRKYARFRKHNRPNKFLALRYQHSWVRRCRKWRVTRCDNSLVFFCVTHESCWHVFLLPLTVWITSARKMAIIFQTHARTYAGIIRATYFPSPPSVSVSIARISRSLLHLFIRGLKKKRQEKQRSTLN